MMGTPADLIERRICIHDYAQAVIVTIWDAVLCGALAGGSDSSVGCQRWSYGCNLPSCVRALLGY